MYHKAVVWVDAPDFYYFMHYFVATTVIFQLNSRERIHPMAFRTRSGHEVSSLLLAVQNFVLIADMIQYSHCSLLSIILVISPGHVALATHSERACRPWPSFNKMVELYNCP